MRRCQFHQYFTSSVCVWKFYAQLFCTYRFFGKKKLAKKLLIRCWFAAIFTCRKNWAYMLVKQNFTFYAMRLCTLRQFVGDIDTKSSLPLKSLLWINLLRTWRRFWGCPEGKLKFGSFFATFPRQGYNQTRTFIFFK